MTITVVLKEGGPLDNVTYDGVVNYLVADKALMIVGIKRRIVIPLDNIFLFEVTEEDETDGNESS